MTTMYKISMLTVIATLTFVLTPFVNHSAAEDPPATASEKNLFKPESNEGISKETDSAKKSKKADISHLELFGTIILGDKKRALIYDNSRQQAEGTQEQKRAGVYYLGDAIGDYVLSAIEEKRVIFDYHGEKVTLTLSEGKAAGRGDYTPLEGEKSTPAKQKSRVKKGAPEKKSDTEPAPEITSPIMSPEEAEEIVEFSKEILEDMGEDGQNVDQKTIEEKKEELRKMFLEKLDRMEQTGQETP